MAYEFDLFIVGAGSGGVRSARLAAARGLRVGLAEQSRYGGTCVIRGCVPKKLLHYAALCEQHFSDAESFGWKQEASPVFSWQTFKANLDKEIDRLERVYRQLLEDAGVKSFDQRAKITAPGEAVLDSGERIRANKILLAAGGRPYKPEIPGAEWGCVSDDIFRLETLPRRWAIYGGGYIALEMACILQKLAGSTCLIYRGPQILRGFDGDIRHKLAEEVVKSGLELRLNEEISSVSHKSSGLLELSLKSGQSLEVDALLFATGRVPNSDKLGLESLGVERDGKDRIVVDEEFQTSLPGLYALGDLSNRINLTPVALREASVFVDQQFGRRHRLMDYQYIPSAVFSSPELAICGLNEEQARERLGEVKVFSGEFTEMKNQLPQNGLRAFFKLIVSSDDDRVVGAHIISEQAAEIMQGFAVAMKMGATKADFDACLGIHPTSAEELVTLS